MVNQFGRKLYSIFFKTYTEKVWGMPCDEMSADWAAQRIKGLSLGGAVIDGLKRSLGLNRRRNGDAQVKTLIESFRYPRLGPGMMWDAARDKVLQQGNTILMGHALKQVSADARTGRWRVAATTSNGETVTINAAHVISSAPLRELAARLHPLPAAMPAAAALRYRDFLTVALTIRSPDLFPDNWIYIHDPKVKVGRIQNFRSWSPEMVPDPAIACVGLEYFCFEGDGLWSADDTELVALATREMAMLGLVSAEQVTGGVVVRQEKAYPVYDDDYARNVDALRRELETRYPTLHCVGRNGMHRYNNQDHAMMTAMLTVPQYRGGRQGLRHLERQRRRGISRGGHGRRTGRACERSRGARAFEGRMNRHPLWPAVLGSWALAAAVLCLVGLDGDRRHALSGSRRCHAAPRSARLACGPELVGRRAAPPERRRLSDALVASRRPAARAGDGPGRTGRVRRRRRAGRHGRRAARDIAGGDGRHRRAHRPCRRPGRSEAGATADAALDPAGVFNCNRCGSTTTAGKSRWRSARWRRSPGRRRHGAVPWQARRWPHLSPSRWKACRSRRPSPVSLRCPGCSTRAGRRTLIALLATLFLTALTLHLVTRGPAIWAASCDAMSPGYLAALGVAAAGVALAAMAAPAARIGRLLALLASGGAAGATLLALAPDCLRGPFATLDRSCGGFGMSR